MPKSNITREQLLNFNAEINNMEKYSIFKHWFSSRINEFRRMNNIQVATTVNRSNDLLEKYFKLDKDGKIIREMVDGKEQNVMNEGMTEEAFKAERKLMLAEQVTVEI